MRSIVSTSAATTVSAPTGHAPNAPQALPATLKTYVAWRFDQVLSGTFKRNKAQFAHHDYPILGPLPTAARNTPALEPSRLVHPYLYFVCDDQGRVRYVGKTLEAQVLHRWIRPGVGGPAKHYWTHSTVKGGCVFNIADGLKSGRSKHYTLRYVPLAEVAPAVWLQLGLNAGIDLDTAEAAMIRTLCADWNRA